MSRFLQFFVPLLLWVLGSAAAQAQLRVVTWNTYQSPSASVPAELGQMEFVLQAIGDQTRPGFGKTIDVLLLQEQATNFSTTDRILNLLNGTNGAGGYARGTLSPVGGVNDIMQTVIYRTNSVQLVGETQATTINTNSGGTRATMRYQLRPLGYDSAADFYVFNSHLRPSDTTADANRRGVEVSQLRTNADALGEGAHIIYVGDMNFYRTNNAGWIAFTGGGSGRAFDPVNAVGNWNNNSNFTAVHTQNPRSAMDDRFDFQLVTDEVLDGRGFSYITNSYWAFGNTGSHVYDQAIDTGNAVAGLNAVLTNYSTAQISNVFSSLVALSDHLPVVADYQLPSRLGVSTNQLDSRVIIGAVLTNNFAVSNSAPVTVSGGADRLDYAFSGTGQLSATGGGTNFALTSADNHSFTFSASNAGTNTGALVVSASSPQAANANLTNHFTVEALHRASPSFASNASALSLEIDLGTLNFGDAAAMQSFDIFNRAGALGSAWTARLDLDSLTAGVPAGIFSTTLSPFANLNAGSAASYQVSMASGALGDFSGTYTLNLSDENLPGGRVPFSHAQRSRRGHREPLDCFRPNPQRKQLHHRCGIIDQARAGNAHSCGEQQLHGRHHCLVGNSGAGPGRDAWRLGSHSRRGRCQTRCFSPQQRSHRGFRTNPRRQRNHPGRPAHRRHHCTGQFTRHADHHQREPHVGCGRQLRLANFRCR